MHIGNLRPPNSFWGVSDLRDVVPLNRELDERVSDQADLIRYHADPPVIFKGVDEHTDLAVTSVSGALPCVILGAGARRVDRSGRLSAR